MFKSTQEAKSQSRIPSEHGHLLPKLLLLSLKKHPMLIKILSSNQQLDLKENRKVHMLPDSLYWSSYPSLTSCTDYLCAYHSSFSKTLQKSLFCSLLSKSALMWRFSLSSVESSEDEVFRNEEDIAARSRTEHSLNPSSWKRERLKEFRWEMAKFYKLHNLSRHEETGSNFKWHNIEFYDITLRKIGKLINKVIECALS